jgi:PAS domain S-box-containing protein
MNTERLHLLIAEDEAAHIEAIRRAFETADAEVEIRAVGTLREFRACAQENPPDLALVDLNLPDGRAVEVLTHPPEDAPFPILVMTAYGTQQIVVEVMKAGALEYVVKSPEAFATLPHTVERALREWKLLQKHKQVANQVRFHAQLLDSVSESVVATDLEGRIVFWGRGAEKLYGYKAEEVLGQPYRNFAGPLEPPDEEIFRKDLIAAGSWRGEHIQRKNNGASFWTSTFISLVTDEHGHPTGFIGIDQDITGRKQTEEALRSSEEKYRQLVENAQESVYVVQRGRVVFANAMFATLAGLAPSEVLGVATEDFVAEEDRSMLREHHRQLIAGETAQTPLDVQVHPRKGAARWVSINAVRIAWQGQPATLNFATDITDRKQVETERQKLAAHETIILATIPDLIMEVDNDQVYTWANHAGLEFFGTDVVGRKAMDFFAGEQETLATVQPLFNGHEQVIYLESWQRRKDGEKRLLAWWCHTRKDPRGQVIGALSTARDITEQKQAEEALRQSEAKKRHLFETMAEGVFYQRADGVLTDVNTAALRMFGLSRNEFLNRTSLHSEWDVIREDGTPLPGPEHPSMQVLRTGQPLQNLVVGVLNPKTQVYTWVSASGIPEFRDGESTPFQVVVTMHDLTERKRAEEALRESEERYRTILNTTPDGIVILDTEGCTRMVSPAAAKMFGFDPKADLRGVQMADFIAPEDRERALANMALSFQGRLNGPIEYRARRVDGSFFDMEVNAETIRDADGKSAQMVAAVRDITDRKQRDAYRDTSREILRILNEPGSMPAAIQHMIAALKTRTGIDAVGIRLQEGEDFPYTAQQGFSPDFLRSENTLVARMPEGGVCRDKDGKVNLECTCGLVISGRPPSAHPLFTKGGSFWTNDSFPLLDLPADQDPRLHPRNQCMHHGYASMALVPIRAQNRIVGLIHLNDRRKGCFTPDAIEILESIAAQIGAALRRKQAEEKLRESEARLSSAQEMAHAGHWEYDIPSDTFTFNDNFYRIFRTTAEQVGGYQMSSAEYARRFCHPDDIALVGQEIQASNVSTDPNYSRQIEHRILYSDGTVGHIAVRFFVVKDPQGRTIKTRGVNQDITAYKQAEEALRASQQITEGIINTIPMRVFWKDKDLVFLGCNKAFARDAGFLDPKDLVGKNDSQMSWRAQAELYRADDRQVIESGRPKLFIEEPQTTPDGKTITLLTSKLPLRNAQGEITGVLGTYMDITERKQIEEKLRTTELRLREIATNIPGVVYQLTVNRKGFFEVPFMSAGYENLFERHLEGMDYAALWFDHMLADDQVLFRQSLAAAAKRMEQWTVEFRIATPDGRIKWVRGSANPQPLPTGGILWNGVLLDITERKQAEEKAEQEQALNKAIIESIPGTFYMLDETGKYVRWSAYQRDEIVGKPDDQVAQTNALSTIHPDDRAHVQSKIENVLKTGVEEVVEGRVLLRGGPKCQWLLMTGRQMVVAGHPFLVGIGIDITQRKQAEEQMAKQLDELRRWQTVTLGREGRIAELKREVNALAVRLGQSPPYPSVEEK